MFSLFPSPHAGILFGRVAVLHDTLKSTVSEFTVGGSFLGGIAVFLISYVIVSAFSF